MVPLNTNEPCCNPSSPTRPPWKASPPPSTAGYRAVCVQITDVSGVAGLIQPGSHVDVLFTRPGSMAEATTSTILQNVKVLATGRTLAVGQTLDPRAPKAPAVTLVCCPQTRRNSSWPRIRARSACPCATRWIARQAANTRAHHHRSARPDDQRPAGPGPPRTHHQYQGRANLEDPKVWQELTGEKKPVDPQDRSREEARRKKAEPEKPRSMW